MSDSPELALLRSTLLSIYREAAPEGGTAGEFLVRRLAAELYQRGGRVTIGTPIEPPQVTIHHSLDPDQRFVWTCKAWNQTMGYRSGAMVGHPIAEVLAPDSYAFLKEVAWPELRKTGRVIYPTLTLVTRNGELLPARGRCEILKDSAGEFLRTFAKIKTRIPLLVPATIFAAAACLTLAAKTTIDMARPRHTVPVMIQQRQLEADSPVIRRRFFRTPKTFV